MVSLSGLKIRLLCFNRAGNADVFLKDLTVKKDGFSLYQICLDCSVL